MTRNINEELKEINIHNITNDEYFELFREFAYRANLYEDKKVYLRNLDLKWYFFDYNWWHLGIEKEILLFKLFKYWLIEIDLYRFECDIDSLEWKEFYKFMDKYSRVSEEHYSQDVWKIQYDIKSIIENEYDKFINHIFKNIESEYKKIQSNDLDIDDLEEILYDRFLMIAYLNSSKVFFEKLNKLLVKEENTEKIINDLVIKLKNSRWEIRLNLKSIIEEKQWIIYFLLKYLESKGKLEITSIKVELNEIIYKINYFVNLYDSILFANFSYEYDNRIETNKFIYENWMFKVWNTEIFNTKKETKIHSLFKLIFDSFNYYNKNDITIEELEKYFIANSINYPLVIKSMILNYDEEIRKNIQDKCKDIEKKYNIIFSIGISKSWFNCQNYNPEK